MCFYFLIGNDSSPRDSNPHEVLKTDHPMILMDAFDVKCQLSTVN